MDDFNSQDTYHSFSSPPNSQNQASSQPQSQDQQQQPSQSQASQYTLDGAYDEHDADTGWTEDDILNLLEYDPVHDSLSSQQPSSLPSSMPATTRSSRRAAQQQRPSRPALAEPSSSAPATTTTNNTEAGGERARKRRRLNGQGHAANSAPFASNADNSSSDFSGFEDDLAELLGSRFVAPATRDFHPTRHQHPLHQSPTLTPNHGRLSAADFADFIPLDDDSSPARPGHASSGNPDTPSRPVPRPGASRSLTRDSGVQTVDPGSQLQQQRRPQGGPGGGPGGGGSGGGDLETIDLTAVTDAASLRQRELIDEQERRARREASMKMEARKAANQRMLKSTLAEQQRVEENKDASGHKGIGDMQCVICMDDFTDLTATHCGHLFCHTCINEHLITAEMGVGNRSALCPFCRQPVYRSPTRSRDKDKTIVPLSFKVKSRASSAKNGTATATGAGASNGAQVKEQPREVERPD